MEGVMKIAVTSKGNNFDDQVDPRFGRCSYFLIIETETMKLDPIENPNIALGGGAGIQSAQLMAERDVKVILTGNCGPNAFQTMNAAGIEVIVGVSGKVRDVVEQFKSGLYSTTQAPNVVSHFGMGNGANPAFMDNTQSPGQQIVMGRGIGGGRGMGRGMGRGKGRGMGRGMGSGQDSYSVDFQPIQGPIRQAGQSEDNMPEPVQELDALKAQAQAIKQQLHAINERIAQIESGTVSHGLIAVVNAEKCTACGLCEGVCPVGAIKIDTVAIIDRAECTGCGQCVAECPREAITLKKV
jgi:predicted Fe-Mo cluster-binding NifX family protein/ferredoxin